MIFSKRLLLKVVGGGIGLIGTGGAVAYRVANSNSKKNGVDVNSKVAESVKNVKERVVSDLVHKKREEKRGVKVDELGISVECKANEVDSKSTKQTCQLFDFQIEKIKFELGRGQSKVSLNGLNWKNKFTLTIEYTDDSEHFPNNKKYIFTNEENDKDVEIEGIKGGNAMVKMGKLGVTFRKTSSGNKLEKAPLEDKFGIPLSCQSYKVKANEPQTCQLTEAQLKKVKFEKEVKSSITVTGLRDKKVNLTISDASNDTTNYPKGKKYSFKSEHAKVTISGTKEGDIVLEGGKEVTFGEKNENVLERVVEINNLGIPRVCEKSECDLGKKDLEKVKFSGFTSGGTIVGGLEGDKKIRLSLENSSYIFKGMDKQVILTNGNQRVELNVGYYYYYKGNSGSLVKDKEVDEFSSLGIPTDKCSNLRNNKECQLNVSDLKNIKFSVKGDKKDLTVTPASSSKTITLKIESVPGEQEYTDGIRYILKDIKEKIAIGEGNNKITLNKDKDDEIWFRKNEKGELEKVRAVPKVDNLGVPVWCNFGKDENSPLECDLEVHYLEKIRFSFGEGKPLKATVTEGSPTIKLKRSKVDLITKEDKWGEAFSGVQMKHIFEIKEGNVKVSKGDEEIHLKKGTNVEFVKDRTTNTLKRAWNVEKIGKNAGLPCKEKDVTCMAINRDTSIKVFDGSEMKEGDMKKGISSSKEFRYYKDQEGYNQGFRFVPEEDIPLLKTQNKKLTRRDSFEIKYHYLKNDWYLTKVNK